MIVVLVGLSGSGKSFLASILHEEFGFEWLRSDRIRKEMAGLSAEEKVKAGYCEHIYSPDWTRKVYEELIKRAEKAEKSGRDVVLDATFLEEWQRTLVKERFPEAVFLFVWADEPEIVRRLRERKDISDADLEVYIKQKSKFTPPDYAIPVNTQKSREELRAVLRDILLLLGWKGTQKNSV